MPVTKPVVLFDGICSLCSGAVRFLIRRDAARALCFAPFQSEAGQRLLRAYYPDKRPPETVVLVEPDRVSEKSSAILRIVRYLKAPWPILYVLIVVPKRLRDWLYDVVAARRYAWFGRQSDVCEVPEANRVTLPEGHQRPQGPQGP